MNDSIEKTIHNMPKIDLHCHIDGSFSTDYVKKTLNLPQASNTLKKELEAPKDCGSLAEYLTRFDLPIKCMQTKSDISLGIIDILGQCRDENIVYVELRFAPTCSLNDNLTYKDIFEAAIDGINAGRQKYNIESNIIACAMRHHSMKDNMSMLRTARDYLGYGICALDLAGDENAYGNECFRELFEEASRINMPFTIHSGECGNSENIRLALEYGAKRIGHGLALTKDTTLMAECVSRKLGFELCPTSNYQTHAVSPDTFYPLRYFLDSGIAATINTDNRTVSGTTLSGEYSLVYDKYGITEEDFPTLYKNSVELSFADDNIKNKLLKLI